MNNVAGNDAGNVLGNLGEEALDGAPPYGDAGVATLVLDIEQGFAIEHNWITDVRKFRAGNEQRDARNADPLERYSGSVYLSGSSPRAFRSLMARYASLGSRFLLALPHEALTLRADSSGATVFVHPAALARRDWVVSGQRAVVVRRDPDTMELDFIDVVVQDSTADSIDLDLDPGSLGQEHSSIMPVRPIYLEPQQGADRQKTAVERWKLNARAAAPFGYAPQLASETLAGAFDGLTAVARSFGVAGNTYQLEVRDFAGVGAVGNLIEGGGFVQWFFEPGVSTPADFVAALAGSAFIAIGGTPSTPAVALTSSDNFFVSLSGGTDYGPVGTGASLTMYDGDGTSRPVWDMRIANTGSNSDGVHAMTKIIDHGGVPYSLGTADNPDWYRAIAISGGREADWQWFRLFMYTVVGRQKKFWLPTWRPDLTFVSKAANTITVSMTDGSDFFGWWPKLREHIQIVETNDTITRCKITAAVDNGNGTATLTIGTTIATSSVSMISWLELCRFERDDYKTTHTANGFAVPLVARVVP